jgi:uncharacterized protein (TIGR02145 family)
MMFGGCRKDKDEAPSLSINPSQTEVKFKADGSADGNATFVVTTNQDTWKAESSQAWLTVNKTATGFALVAAANTATTAPAAATVTVTAGTATPVTLSVTQAAAAPVLSLDHSSAIAFAADGTTGNAVFVVTSNTAWDAVSSQAWLTVNKTAAGFTLVAAAAKTDPAPATVTVSASGVENVVIHVTQEGYGVLINGVIWARYNVDAPKTFTATPEAYGKFYQWNRATAWNTTDETVTGWDTTVPDGSSWAADICPTGWRLPTTEEQRTLVDATKVTNKWETQNGVTGRLFTDIATTATLFLPAAGYRYRSDGRLSSADTYGDYWSSTADGATNAYYLDFSSGYADWYYGYRSFGFSVRCVAE